MKRTRERRYRKAKALGQRQRGQRDRLNDDENSKEYVMDLLEDVFGHARDLGLRMAEEVHEKGRVICATVHKELAELRQEQVHEYKPRNAQQGIGSMRCVIEPSE